MRTIRFYIQVGFHRLWGKVYAWWASKFLVADRD